MARGGSLGTISVDLEARIAKFESDIGRAARLLEREMSRSAKQSERAITEMRKTVEREMQAVRRTMEQTRTLVAGVFSFQLATRFAGMIREFNDGFINVQAQLRQTTTSQKQLTVATEETFKVAQRTYASFESTGLLIGRTARALQSAGRDQRTALQESLRFSEAINNAFILSGAKAIEAKNAILQLSQGLSSGTLRGDEYRSVAEQGAKVTQILAKNLTEVDGALQLANGRMGVTTGRLRELAYEGKLTTDLVVSAMLAGFSELALGVGDIPLTIERAFTQLRNAAENYIGTSTSIAQLNQSIAKSIAFLAENFKVLADSIIAVGTALTIALAGRGIGAVAAFATRMAEVTAARRADAAATLAQAQAAELAAKRQLLQNEASRNAARVALENARMGETEVARQLRTNIALVEAERARATAMGQTRRAAMLNTATLQKMLDQELRSTAVLTSVGNARAELTRQNTLYATSQRDVAAASSRTAAALSDVQKQAATAFATMSRLGAGFLSIIGGWPTIILGAVYALYELYSWLEKVEEAQMKEVRAIAAYNERLEERLRLEEEMRRRGTTSEEENELVSNYEGAQQKVAELRAEMERLLEFQQQLAQSSTREGAGLGVAVQIQDVQQKLEEATRELEKFVQLNSEAGIIIPGSMEPVMVTMNNMAQVFGILTGAAEELNTELKNGVLFSDEGAKYIDKLNEEIATMGMSRDMMVVYTASRKAANEEDEKARQAIIDRALVLAEAIRQEEKNKSTVKEVVDIERKREAAAREALRTQKQREKAIKDENTALRQLELNTRRYSGTLSGPMLRALEENAKLQEELNKLMDELLDIGPPTEEMYEKITAAMAAYNGQMEQNVATARMSEDVRGEVIAGLDAEARMLQMTETERQVYETMERAIADAREDNIQLTPAYINSLEAEVRARVQSIEQMKLQMEQQQVYRDIMIQGAEDIGNAFAEFVVESEVKFDDFADEMVNIAKSMVKRMLAEFIKLQFINPMMNAMFGMNLPTGGGTGGLFAMAASALGGGGSSGGGSGGSLLNMGAGRAGSSALSWLGNSPTAQSALTYAPYLAAAGGAMYGFQNRGGSNGSGGSLAAGAAYGYAGYALGTVATGALLGAGAGAATGVAGAAAGGALAGGAGAAAAIPVIGWIVAALALIDAFSGGKLFGTRFKPDEMVSTIGIENGEAFTQTNLTEVRNRSLFRGRQWRTTAMEDSPEAIAAAEALFSAVDRTMTDAARAIGAEAPELLDIAIRTVQDFDSKGRATTSKMFVDVLGRSWEAATQDEAATRIAAEAIIATIDGIVSPVQREASRIAEQWRDDVEALMQGAQFLVMIAADINRGFGLLGDDGSLTDVYELTEELNASGESLADTYSRLVGSVRLLEDALSLSEVQMDLTREEFVRFAADIAQAAGGLDRATQLWQNYFSTFFTAEERALMQLTRAEGAVGTAATGLGLNPEQLLGPAGAQAFRNAFTAALPTLTPAQVVLWLELGEYLGQAYAAQQQYNEALGQTGNTLAQLLPAAIAYAEFVMGLREELESMDSSDFVNEIRGLGAELGENIAQLDQLAQAAGMAGPRVEDLALATELAARKMAKAIAALKEASLKLVEDLYGTPLSRLDAEIAALEASSRAASDGVGTATDAIETFVDRTRRAVEDLLLDDSLSPLGDREKLQLALQRVRETGSEDDARTALQIGRRLMASGTDYERLFRQVTSLVRVVDQQTTPGSTGGGGVTVSAELQALYDRRAALLAEQEAAQRRATALQLAQNLADYAGATQMTFEDVAAAFGFTLDQLAEDLGMERDELMNYLETLQADSYDLMQFVDVYNEGVNRIVNAVLGIVPDKPGQFTGPGYRGLVPAVADPVYTEVSSLDRPLPLTVTPPEIPGLPGGQEEPVDDGVIDAVEGMNENVGTILERIHAANESAAVSLRQIADIEAQRSVMKAAMESRTVLSKPGRELVR